MGESHMMWVLTIPVTISLIASLGKFYDSQRLLFYLSSNNSMIFANITVFLVNVVRVLLTKLHPAMNPAPVGMRKAVRATLILVLLSSYASVYFSKYNYFLTDSTVRIASHPLAISSGSRLTN